jgi:hypothetical protein
MRPPLDEGQLRAAVIEALRDSTEHDPLKIVANTDNEVYTSSSDEFLSVTEILLCDISIMEHITFFQGRFHQGHIPITADDEEWINRIMATCHTEWSNREG